MFEIKKMEDKSAEGALVFILSGRLDNTNAQLLDAALQDAIKNGEKKIDLELSTLDFIASSGMRAMLKANIQLKDREGGMFQILHPSDYVMESLKFVGLDKVLTIVQ